MKLNSFAAVSLAASSWPGNYFSCMDSNSVYMIALLLILSGVTILTFRRNRKNRVGSRI